MSQEEKTRKKKSLLTRFCDSAVYVSVVIPAEMVRLMSLKSAYRLAKFVAFLFYWLDAKHRKRVIKHILHSGIVSDRESAIRLAKKNFLHMVKVFVEIIKFDQIITKENYRDYISCDKSIPEFAELNDPATSQPIILTSMHIGNWELAANCYNFYTKVPICSIMRPLENEKIGNYFYRKRVSTDHQTVSRDLGIRPLLAAIREKRTVAIVADQHANHTEGVEAQFFGHPARTHMTPALLHLKSGFPLVPEIMIRLDDDFHFMITGGMPLRYTPTGDKEADIRAITQYFNDEFEKLVRKYPDQWLWAHRRWLDCGRRLPWSPDHFNSQKELNVSCPAETK